MNTNAALLKNKNQFVDTCENFASVNDLRIAKILAERDEASKDPNTPRIPIDEAIGRLREKMHNL